jgi:hypothetical protein
MPVYVGNGSLEGGGSALTVKDSSGNAVFAQGVAAGTGGSFGYFNNTSVPGFIAGSATDPGWVAVTSGTWAKINQYATTTTYNRGSNYNTSTTRFTAPVTGPYLFIWSAYTYQASYTHPVFAVNGDLGGRHISGTPTYRIRGYGYISNYATDTQIEEVYYLTAGDYVEVYMYAGGGTAYSYAFYCLFAGIFVG